METDWKKALESNKPVKIGIQPTYSGNSKRPISFSVEQQINGINLPTQILQNTATGK